MPKMEDQRVLTLVQSRKKFAHYCTKFGNLAHIFEVKTFLKNKEFNIQSGCIMVELKKITTEYSIDLHKKVFTTKPSQFNELQRLNLMSDLNKDKVICLQCGKYFQILKRHINIEHNLSEDDYRFKFGVAIHNQLVAQSYSEKKSKFLEENLGRSN